jgi:hypothetical protein
MPFGRVVTASALDEAVLVADVAARIGLAGRAKICLPLFLIADMARPPLTAIARALPIVDGLKAHALKKLDPPGR